MASVWWVLRKARNASNRAEEKPSDSGVACAHSVPGSTYPWPSANPSGGRSGAAFTGDCAAACAAFTCASALMEQDVRTGTHMANINQSLNMRKTITVWNVIGTNISFLLQLRDWRGSPVLIHTLVCRRVPLDFVFNPRLLTVLACLLVGKASVTAAPVSVVPQCRDVTLSASFLAETTPGQGSGFYLTVQNRRAAPIAIPDPAPLSVHWYAQTGQRWLWRASSGSGGSLVNALREKGPLFADPGPPAAAPAAMRLIAGHSSYNWTVFAGANPVLRYRPGCQHCAYQGEEQFHAVVAYAYLPSEKAAPEPNSTAARLLHCGLRSNPVVMPPLPAASDPHNSRAR